MIMAQRAAGFVGQYQTTLDEKGRFALPARLRAVKGPSGRMLLAGSPILTKGLEGCLSLYPEVEWGEIQNRLSSLNFTQKDFRYFSRRFYSSASGVKLDRSGRILVPAHLLKEAGLDRELLVIGVNRWIEIWNRERYKYYLEQYAGSYEEVAERLFTAHGSERE
ncbi:MAG: division/cell wall cluster transcriptional repressor MraZ [candidate division Zixibacteria bacterium]|nr:division/cell wall cluster transcriptional repressor MraZ [candidate division Zixibacteria bacterium]